jgi:hypothetical protein
MEKPNNEALDKMAPLKPLNVHIKAINTAAGMNQNTITGEISQQLQVIGLGDDDKIYVYDGVKKEWRLL